MFYPVKGYNKFCGPTALALLIGCTTDEAAIKIRYFTGKKMAKGVAVEHMMQVLLSEGWRPIRIPPFIKTVKALSNVVDEYEPGFYLANITGHYLVLERYGEPLGNTRLMGWRVADNQQKTPVPLSRHIRYQTHRIKFLWYLVPPGHVTGL